MKLLKYMTYTDADGITRDLTIATWNGKTIIIDDSVPTKETYTITKDTEIDYSKIYFIKDGEDYVEVDEPNVDDIATYYEQDIEYTTYLFGDGVIERQPVPVKHPYEMTRDAHTKGGLDTLIHRWRTAYGVKGISYEKKKQKTLSPTNEELADGSNWVLVNDGGTKPEYYDHKAIPIARIISKG